MEINKIPPQAIEIEEIVLGALLIESEAFNKIDGVLTQDCFYVPAHKIVFKTISNLILKNKPVDLATVAQSLMGDNNLDNIGGALFLTKLTNKVASAGHIQYHAAIIKQKYIQRQIINIGFRMAEEAYNEEYDIDLVIDKHIVFLDNLKNGDLSEISTMKEALDGLTKIVTNREKKYREKGFTGVNTGLGQLNKITGGGWQNGDLIIVGARPSMGKTALALKLAKTAAMNDDTTAMFSLEMTKYSLVERMCYGAAGIDIDNFKQGCLTNKDWDEYSKAYDFLCNLPIFISDKSYDSIASISNKCKKLKRDHNLKLIIIDYLQLANMQGDEGRNREQEVAKASRMLKALAKELDVPVILLSQLNRSSVTGIDKRPQLFHLRESGAIEQDADMVLFIHRESYYCADAVDNFGNSWDGRGELLIRKNRNGQIGTVVFKHNESLTVIMDDCNYSIEPDSNPF